LRSWAADLSLSALYAQHKKDAHVAVARSVEGAAELVTTGPFRMLSGELTLQIFLRVPEMWQRLSLVSEVCKGWRSLRKEPCLWKSVLISEKNFSSKGAVTFCDPSTAKSPLVSAEVVETLSLVCGKKIDARSIKAILKSLIHATSVSLEGKKVSPDCLALLAKRGKGAAPLRELHCSYLGSESGGKSVAGVTLEIIAAQPELAVLEIKTQLTKEWMTEAGQRARIARKGGNSLLTSLKVGCSGLSWMGGMTLGALERLGTAFPELSSLDVSHLNQLAPYYRSQWGVAVLPAAFSPLPRLKSLTINDMINDASNYGATSMSSSVVVGAILRCIAAAAPGLLKLKVARGFSHYGDPDAGGPPITPPSVGAVLSGLGLHQCLTHLTLSNLVVLPSEAAGCDMPSLQYLILDRCGPRVLTAAVMLTAAAPQLRSLVVEVGSPREAEDSLAALASPSLELLHLRGIGWSVAVSSMNAIARAAALPKLESLAITRPEADRQPVEASPNAQTAVDKMFSGGAAGGGGGGGGGASSSKSRTLFISTRGWPHLRYLEIPADCAVAELPTLDAPKLRMLALPPFMAQDGTFTTVAKTRYGEAMPHRSAQTSIIKAYEEVRQRCSPMLPPPRELSAMEEQEANRAAAMAAIMAAAATTAAAAAGAQSDEEGAGAAGPSRAPGGGGEESD
jgi:hypothetical protein